MEQRGWVSVMSLLMHADSIKLEPRRDKAKKTRMYGCTPVRGTQKQNLESKSISPFLGINDQIFCSLLILFLRLLIHSCIRIHFCLPEKQFLEATESGMERRGDEITRPYRSERCIYMISCGENRGFLLSKCITSCFKFQITY